MERRDRIDLFGGTVLVSFSMLLGLNQVMVKMVNAGMQPVFQAGMRSAAAFLPVLIFAWVARRRLSLSDGSFGPGVLSGLFFSLEFIALFKGIEYTSVARASVMLYSMPVWLAIGAHFLIPGETMTPRRALGLASALGGVALALSVNQAPATEHALLGDALCLAAGMFWAGIALTARKSRLAQSAPEMQLLYQLGVSAIVVTAAAPLFGPLIRDLTPMILGIFAFQVLSVACVAYLVWFWVLSIYPASDMASYGFLTPMFGVLFGWLILGEPITATTVAALVLVAAGIALVTRKPKPQPA